MGTRESAIKIENKIAKVLVGSLVPIAFVLMTALQNGSARAATLNIPDGDVAALIAAINTANGNGEADTINLASAGTYTLTAEDNAGNGLPIITSQITINGNGATVERSSAPGTPGFRLLQITGPNAGDLTLDDVTIKGGSLNASGGGIYNYAGTATLIHSTITSNYGQAGGGIFNENGTLTVHSSAIRGNTSFYYGAGIWNHGNSYYSGGLWNIGNIAILTLADSTVSDNLGGGYRTGAIVNTGGDATLTNSTVSGNSSTGQGAGGILNWAGAVKLINSTVSGNIGSGYGGGISNVSPHYYYYGLYAALTAVNSTVSGNQDIGGAAGGIHNDSVTTSLNTATLKSTIVANSSPADCFGLITTLGYNLAGDASCGFAGIADLNGTDPLLGVLTNNGGPSESHMLLAGSPAIDAVPFGDCTDALGVVIAADQRGVVRPQGAACDSGSVELDSTPPETTVNSALDGNGAMVADGGSTLSGSITFSFGGIDGVGVTGFQCSLDGAAYAACASPVAYSALAIGSHAFRARAVDAAGNVDPSPASFTWTVVTPAQAIQNLITTIGSMGLPGGVATSLTAPLSNIDTNKKAAACGKLNAFINQVNAKTPPLTGAEGSQLLQAANAIKASLGC